MTRMMMAPTTYQIGGEDSEKAVGNGESGGVLSRVVRGIGGCAMCMMGPLADRISYVAGSIWPCSCSSLLRSFSPIRRTVEEVGNHPAAPACKPTADK